MTTKKKKYLLQNMTLLLNQNKNDAKNELRTNVIDQYIIRDAILLSDLDLPINDLFFPWERSVLAALIFWTHFHF